MRDIGEGTVRRIDWQELTPVVRLLRIFSAATDFRVMFLSVIGVLLTLIAGYLVNVSQSPETLRPNEFVIETIDLDDTAAEPVLRPDGPVTKRFSEPVYIEPLIDFQGVHLQKAEKISFRDTPGKYAWDLANRSVFVPWDVFSKAGFRLFSISEQSWKDHGIALFWFVFLVFLWTLLGGMICRTVAVRLTIDQAESPGNLWRFMKDRGTGFLSSMTIIVLFIVILVLMVMLAGWLYSIPGVNYVVGFGFPVVMLFSFLAVLMALGLLVGWPMLFAAVSVDGSDGFDAVSRTYSYVYQRPLHYLFYWTIAGVLGMLGFVIVSIFVDGVVYLSITMGGFPAQAALPSFGHLAIPEATTKLDGPATLVLTWCALAQLLKLAFTFAWFWTTGVAVYLLLRRSVDATPFSEVLRLGAASAEPRVLPDIKLDEKGAPEIVEN